MANEIPEGLAIEDMWVIEAAYAPDAAQRRAPVRAEHLSRIGRLQAEGTVVLAGAYGDMSGSLVVVRAPDEEAALAIVKADVYTRSGVWTAFRARPMGVVVRTDRTRS